MSQTLTTWGHPRKYDNEKTGCCFCNRTVDFINTFMYRYTCECCGEEVVDICVECAVLIDSNKLMKVIQKLTHKSIDLV